MVEKTKTDHLLKFARLFWPELDSMRGLERDAGVYNVVYSVTYLPVFFASLTWLAISTDIGIIRDEWLIFLLFLALMVLFEVLNFYWFMEITPGGYSSGEDSLWILVGWTAVLIYGPTGLWLFIIKEILIRSRLWSRNRTKSIRWDILRNFVLITTGVLLGGMVAVSLYQEIGGGFPLPGLEVEFLLPAAGVTLVYLILSFFSWAPFMFSAYRMWRKIGGSTTKYVRLFSVGIQAQVLAVPFTILAAGLYTQLGVGIFLYYISGWLLTSLLAQQLSRVIQRSQERSQELARLEQLGRAILASPPDGSALPELLREHTENMFAFCRIEIRMFPDQVFVHHPDDWSPVDKLVWDWLQNNPTGASYAPKTSLPWGGKDKDWGTVIVPILDLEDSSVIGGICLRKRRDARMISALQPAVQTLADQVASAFQRVKTYNRALAHERLAQEITLAGRIQASFLPEEVPHITGWEVAAELIPARETSGDFYDFILLGENKLGIIVADVADKGMGAALYMAMCRTLLRTYVDAYPNQPEVALSSANRRILADTQTGMMVTTFVAILDTERGVLTWCNAGHNPPYIVRINGSILELGRTGVPLGLFEDSEWQVMKSHLNPGDAFIAYTDGIPDAENSRSEYYGSENLRRIAKDYRGCGAATMIDQLIGDIRSFTGEAPQFDDITLVALTRDSIQDEDQERANPV